MKKWLSVLLVSILFFSCEKQNVVNETAIELGFNSGYETPSTDKPIYKSTDSIKYEIMVITNINIPKNQINISLDDEKGVFEMIVRPTDDEKYVNFIKGYFKPLNKTGDFDFNIKLSNHKTEKLITKKILVLSELNVDDVLPVINRQRIINAFPLYYEFCNFSASKVISSSKPTEVKLGIFNLDGNTNNCSRKRVFINGFNGEINLNYNFDGKFESVSVKHGNTNSYASLSLEKILGQLAPFYGQPTETELRIPNTRFAKINTTKGIITVFDNGLSVSSIITPK
jgi:hypothetical protein